MSKRFCPSCLSYECDDIGHLWIGPLDHGDGYDTSVMFSPEAMEAARRLVEEIFSPTVIEDRDYGQGAL